MATLLRLCLHCPPRLFTLSSWTPQTSFLGHTDKAAVTSMAVESRSESVLLTGSSVGEVRVWSLRHHPVARVGGIRCRDVIGGGGDGSRRTRSNSTSTQQSRAITQLGFFEGGGRGVALDGLVHVWDLERYEASLRRGPFFCSCFVMIRTCCTYC